MFPQSFYLTTCTQAIPALRRPSDDAASNEDDTLPVLPTFTSLSLSPAASPVYSAAMLSMPPTNHSQFRSRAGPLGSSTAGAGAGGEVEAACPPASPSSPVRSIGVGGAAKAAPEPAITSLWGSVFGTGGSSGGGGGGWWGLSGGAAPPKLPQDTEGLGTASSAAAGGAGKPAGRGGQAVGEALEAEGFRPAHASYRHTQAGLGGEGRYGRPEEGERVSGQHLRSTKTRRDGGVARLGLLGLRQVLRKVLGCSHSRPRSSSSSDSGGSSSNLTTPSSDAARMRMLGGGGGGPPRGPYSPYYGHDRPSFLLPLRALSPSAGLVASRLGVSAGSVNSGSFGRSTAGAVAEASLAPAGGGGVRQGSFLGGRPKTGSIGSETDDSGSEEDDEEGDDAAGSSGSGGAVPGGEHVLSLGSGNGNRGAQSSAARASLEEAQRQHMASLESDRVRVVAGGPLRQEEDDGSESDDGDGDSSNEGGEGRGSSGGGGGGGGSGTKRLSVRYGTTQHRSRGVPVC